ncbi:hypothetical protein B0H14DRAFT_2585793 [Mycena olivaceomarginata]|nr:hypothetical protein B0H14DRAFT_2585793 [Mycena olivaceomarginata]
MCRTSFQLSVTLVAIVREALTQIHSKIKKGISKVNKEPAPSAREHQNIFELTTHLIHGTKCAVTLELCMRQYDTPESEATHLESLTHFPTVGSVSRMLSAIIDRGKYWRNICPASFLLPPSTAPPPPPKTFLSSFRNAAV